MVAPPVMQWPTVPILRAVSTAACRSSQATNALPSLAYVAGLSALPIGATAARVAGSMKLAPAASTGALALR